MEIVINTDYYVTEQSLNLTEREGGYGATFNSLPTKELTFSLCSEQNPSYRRVDVYLGRFVVIVLIIVEVISVGLVVFAIVYLVKSRKK